MTTKEFSNEFDILYNSIASNQAPGLDLYEKSVYLSKAQLQIIKNYFNPLGNKYKKGFEQNSSRRAGLRELVYSHTSKNSILDSPHSIQEGSIFFTLPNNLYLIVQESAKLISDDPCINGTIAKVVPKTHDEYAIQIKNPFKNPNKDMVWRLDFHSINTGLKNVELLTSEKGISEYKLRYVKYPEPIILTNLNDAFSGEGLSIDNKTNEQTSLLDTSIHGEILDRAVELATMDYKMQEVQARAQINLRNE
jgi:hypothetical protein